MTRVKHAYQGVSSWLQIRVWDCEPGFRAHRPAAIGANGGGPVRRTGRQRGAYLARMLQLAGRHLGAEPQVLHFPDTKT